MDWILFFDNDRLSCPIDDPTVAQEQPRISLRSDTQDVSIPRFFYSVNRGIDTIIFKISLNLVHHCITIVIIAVSRTGASLAFDRTTPTWRRKGWLFRRSENTTKLRETHGASRSGLNRLRGIHFWLTLIFCSLVRVGFVILLSGVYKLKLIVSDITWCITT